MRQRQWLPFAAIILVGLLTIGALFILFHKQRLEAELSTTGSDMRLLAEYRDSTLLAPNRTLEHQLALRVHLLRSRPTPYRGSRTFIDSLGLWEPATFVRYSRSELSALGKRQTALFSRIEAVDTAQTVLFLSALFLSILLIPLLLLYLRTLRQRLHLLEKLEESEARYREIIEHMPDLIQSVDAEGRFVYVNRYWRRVMGYTDEDLQRLRIWDILRPDQLPKCQSLFEQVFQEQVLLGVETVFITKHGQEIYVSGNVTVRPDPITGKPVTRALFRDVTAQRQQLQLLQYQEALANTTSRIAQQLLTSLSPETLAPSILEQLGETLNTDALYLVALPGDVPQPIAVWTRDVEKASLVAATFEQPCWDLLRPLWERLKAIAIVEAVSEELLSLSSATEANTPNPLLARGTQALLWVPFVRQGQLWGFIGTEDWKQPRFWNPTERTALESVAASLLFTFDRIHAYRELQRFAEDLLQARNMLEAYAEELRRANEELQERNAEKDRIMSIVSHDLRSPLSGIRGLAEILQTEEALDPSTVQEFARLIYEASEYLLNLVNDLLEVARLEQGRIQLQLTETDLCALARSTFRFMEGVARSKNIQLVLECPDSPVVALVDAPKISQVLNNLLSNAIKFTPSGGTVTVRLQPRLENGEVEIHVIDTGIGIPQELLPHLFEKFGPHQRPGTAGERGTGLGMPIIKNFVELHGGTIQVSSTVGIGSHFTIRLPYRCTAETAPSASSSQSTSIPVPPS